MALIWPPSGDAYSYGDFSAFTAVQAHPPERASVRRSDGSDRFVGVFHTEPDDVNRWGKPDSQRCEALVDHLLRGASQGEECWFAWESLFTLESFAPEAHWNVFTQWHQHGGHGPPPWAVAVDTRTMQWKLQTKGGDELDAPTPTIPTLAGSYEPGWHAFLAFVSWGQDNGHTSLWVDGDLLFDLSTPLGFSPDAKGSVRNYLKQGIYGRRQSVPRDVVHAALRIGDAREDLG